MTFDKFNRRLHLYLGLFFGPWLVMYGVSSFILIHESWFGTEQSRVWEPLFEKSYSRPIVSHGVNNEPDLRATAQEILKDWNLEGAFWVDKPKPDILQINRFSFWGSISLTYSIKDQTLKAERQRMKVPQAVLRMHFRGGYGQPDFWSKFWGLLVDASCVGIIIWIGSGLIMWWRLRALRAWGTVAVGAGVVSFVVLVWKL